MADWNYTPTYAYTLTERAPTALRVRLEDKTRIARRKPSAKQPPRLFVEVHEGVDRDTAGHGWNQIGAALATARNLVKKGGKIVVLSQLDAELGEGMTLVRD